VKWSDGQPFTAQDVAFTFNLLKQDPATDLFSLWSAAGLRGATASGDTATLTFSQNAQAYFYDFADQIGIVPQHIWGDASIVGKTPDTWSDPNPVGTGPYEVSPCTANNIQYTANPRYWMPNEPHIQKVEYPAYLSNDPANEDLASGKDQWGNQFIPSIQSFYLDKSANNHTWSPPVTNADLFPNLAQGPTADLKVREAISYALDRGKISEIGEDGEEPAANQTAVISPTFSRYEDTAALLASGFSTPSRPEPPRSSRSRNWSWSPSLRCAAPLCSAWTPCVGADVPSTRRPARSRRHRRADSRAVPGPYPDSLSKVSFEMMR
jgi:peptide/nickel transport system substrate-binding protein